jgi:hypothetical protein
MRKDSNSCEVWEVGGIEPPSEVMKAVFYGFVERGLFVGFRKLDQGGNWIARAASRQDQAFDNVP